MDNVVEISSASPNQVSLTDKALALAAQGYAVFPLGANKKPCRKSPGEGQGGFKEASTDPARVRELFSSPGAALVGVATGAVSGIDVLDLDPRNGSTPWLKEHSEPGPEELPTTTRVHFTPSGGQHFFFRHAAGVSCSSDARIGPGCDVKGDGGYVAWYPATGGEEWAGAGPAEWPDWLLTLTRPRLKSVETGPAALPAPPSAQAVIDLLSRMPNTLETSRDLWTKINLCVRGCIQALGGDDDGAIAEAAIAWAEKYPGDISDVRSKWEEDWSVATAATGWPTLQKHASQMIPGYSLEIASAEFADISAQVSAPAPSPAKWEFRSFVSREWKFDPNRPYVIKDLLAPGDVGMVVGHPSAGKSTFAHHAGHGVAHGRRVMGLRTRQSRVMYVAAEGFMSVVDRDGQMGARYGHTDDFVVTECGNLMDQAARDELFNRAMAFRPALFILDTLAAAFAGLDENDSAGMGVAIAFARRLAARGIAVLFVHHPAKSGGDAPRGHSSLNGTLDMVLVIEAENLQDENALVTGHLAKNRNGGTHWRCAFRKERVDLGRDAEGDLRHTTLVAEVDQAEAQLAKALAPSPRGARALSVLNDMEAECEGAVPEPEWLARCDDQRVIASEDAKNRRDSMRKVYRELVDKRLIGASQDRVWTMRQPASGVRQPASAPSDASEFASLLTDANGFCVKAPE